MFSRDGLIVEVELIKNIFTHLDIGGRRLVVVKTSKRFDSNAKNDMLEKIYSFISSGAYGFVFDFGETDFVDSKGLGFLIHIKNKTSFIGLINVKNKIKMLLNRTGVSSTLNLFDNMKQCLDTLNSQDTSGYVDENIVFISYSHKDKEWLDKLKNWIKPIEKKGLIRSWDDTSIKAGILWKDEIEKYLKTSKLAILLVSQNFLTSDFIVNHELDPILKLAKNRGVVILWIAVSDSTFDETEIASYQALNDPSKPLDSLAAFEQNKVFKDIFRKIKGIIEDQE